MQDTKTGIAADIAAMSAAAHDKHAGDGAANLTSINSAGNVAGETVGKATRISLLDVRSPQMRAFHMTWLAFFLCFFAWFGIAPLMKVVREELKLTQDQVGWCIIGSVAATVISRLLVGWLCDRFGPRRTYAVLLMISALPVVGITLSHNFETFLLFRVLIGLIGASFVITQYHTSVMFAPNCVGTANATAAGWGNLGGGATQALMPLLAFSLFVGTLGFSEFWGWRLSMIVVGVACFLMGVAYLFLTQDTPRGNHRAVSSAPRRGGDSRFASLWAICKDVRVWALFGIYGACFGVELTINNIAALYFVDYFDFFQQMNTADQVKYAGLFASCFGVMNIFARSLGGYVGDRFGARFGLNGRVQWLFVTLFAQGLLMMVFSQMSSLLLAIPFMVAFGLFVKMSNGATYAVVPFVNQKSLGMVSGIVGAGGNFGAVLAGLLFKGSIPWPTALFILGVAVTACAFLTFAVRFSSEAETEAQSALENALRARQQTELAGATA